MAANPTNMQNVNAPNGLFAQYLPFTRWLFQYKRENLTGDVIAGVIVAVMLVPQSMAYAMLAGLPPQVGLYASILPLIIYGLLGTSRVLAVGPVAIVSLLVAEGISQLNPATTAEYLQYALIIALQVAIIQMLMGVLKFGFLVNFLSHPVLSGFTSAAAIIIGFSQLRHLLGYSVPSGDYLHEDMWHMLQGIGQTHPLTLAVGLIAVGVLLAFKHPIKTLLQRLNVPDSVALPLSKTGPLMIVAFSVLAVSLLRLDHAGLVVVGVVPAGLPALTVPPFDLDVWRAVFPIALTISLVGYMESISIAKSLASKKRQKVDPDQELIAMGAANIGAAFTGGYAVTGGLSRTMVNETAGANTGLASIITAGLVALTVLFLTPLFYYLPRAVLAAIIIVAVASLFDLKAFRHAWHYSKSDGVALLVTFGAVLVMGIESGILLGVVASIGLYIHRTSRPHTAVVGRIGDSEHFRNVKRHEVEVLPNAVFFRVDESLYFPNVNYLEQQILHLISDDQQIDHLVLVCHAINYIDLSALETLDSLRVTLQNAGVQFYLAEVKGPVMDRLQHDGFIQRLGEEHVFLSAQDAFKHLQCVSS